MSDFKSDAHDIGPADLLRSAARLVERAIVKLNMAEAACPTCDARLFADRENARIYQPLTDTPERLRNTADRLDAATKEGARASRGYAAAQERKAALVSGPDPRD